MSSRFRVYDGYHKKEFNGVNTWIDFLKHLNSREPCLHHTYQVQKIEINKNTGTLYMSRLEPNRIGSRVIGEHSWFYDWMTLDYTIKVIQVDNQWLLEDVFFITRYHEEKSKGIFEELC